MTMPKSKVVSSRTEGGDSQAPYPVFSPRLISGAQYDRIRDDRVHGYPLVCYFYLEVIACVGWGRWTS